MSVNFLGGIEMKVRCFIDTMTDSVEHLSSEFFLDDGCRLVWISDDGQRASDSFGRELVSADGSSFVEWQSTRDEAVNAAKKALAGTLASARERLGREPSLKELFSL
jgi:hypothetical protein